MTGAFLVRLRAQDRQEQPALREPEILKAQSRQFGAPERRGESYQDYRAIPSRGEVVAPDREQERP